MLLCTTPPLNYTNKTCNMFNLSDLRAFSAFYFCNNHETLPKKLAERTEKIGNNYSKWSERALSELIKISNATLIWKYSMLMRVVTVNNWANMTSGNTVSLYSYPRILQSWLNTPRDMTSPLQSWLKMQILISCRE